MNGSTSIPPSRHVGIPLIDALVNLFDGPAMAPFEKFLKKQQTDSWVTYSDYVFDDAEAVNDVLAFTVTAAGRHFGPLQQRFEFEALKDFKDVKEIDAPMMQLLLDPRVFTLIFFYPRNRRLRRSPADLRAELHAAVQQLEQQPPSESRDRVLAVYRRLRDKASRNSFSMPLFQRMMQATQIAAFIGAHIAANATCERFAWFSDRDNITTAHEGAAHTLFAQSLATLCMKWTGTLGPSIYGLPGQTPTGIDPFSDPANRIPDHFAGAVARLDLTAGRPISDAPKYIQIIREALPHRAGVALLQIDEYSEGKQLLVRVNPCTISRAPSQP